MTKTYDPGLMPAGFADEDALEEFMTQPSEDLVRDLRQSRATS